MSEPKYICVNCASENEPYFSRSEPMGFFCTDCGRNFDRRDCSTEDELAELRIQLHDAKTTADLWMKHAKLADEAAADLKAALADAKKHWKAETEEQARLLGMSGERECGIRGKLERERALADRLAEDLKFIATDKIANANDMRFRANKALTAWKEARSE